MSCQCAKGGACTCGLYADPPREQIKPLGVLNLSAGEALAYAVCIVLTIGISVLKPWDWWVP